MSRVSGRSLIGISGKRESAEGEVVDNVEVDKCKMNWTTQALDIPAMEKKEGKNKAASWEEERGRAMPSS